ncbi:hypothetical protein P7K49_019255 [Saguinus oedipus]|uniref:Uncharacterized protein n=1 Tax=Saguinus oedipus TaxID=9490 RepID=A0ABQ9UXU2_SAGOE|nr:hypothetical protein P7K49_019255 [Saguinus oedipus]
MPALSLKLEDKQRLAQEEESEAKRLAIMTMKRQEKYLYQKIMFGKWRKIREANKLAEKRKTQDETPALIPHALWLGQWAALALPWMELPCRCLSREEASVPSLILCSQEPVT